MKQEDNKQDQTYKVKGIGLRYPGAPHGLSQGQKARKLENCAAKWATTSYILVLPLRSKWIKPKMAWNR